MPANLAAVEGGEPVPTLEHFQNYLSHMAASRAQEEEEEGWRLPPSLIFSFPHSIFGPPLGLPSLPPPQWPVLDLVKLVSEITGRDKEKPAAMEGSGSMSF